MSRAYLLASIRYAICMFLVVVTVFPNLYLAVRAPWKPKDPNQPRPPKSHISSKYLFRAAIACLVLGIATLYWV